MALINDQFGRLEQLCLKAEIPVHRRHGGVLESERRRMFNRPSGVSLITPESLEFVVIDELHAFLDQVRGIHLASLLKRLESASGIHQRLIGLSATLGDFRLAQEFLALEHPESVQIVADHSQPKDLRVSLKAFVETPGPRAEDLAQPVDPVAQEIVLRCRQGSH